MKLTYFNDYLVDKIGITIGNDPSNVVITEKNNLNFFPVFIKFNDLKGADRSKRICYAKGLKDEVLNIIKKFNLEENNYYKVRKQLAEYYLQKGRPIRPHIFLRWIEKDLFPLTFLRVLAHMISDDDKQEIKILANFSTNARYFTDVNDQAKFNPPRTLKNLLNPFNFYLAGCTWGDGRLVPTFWSLSDGVINRNYLHYSLEYLVKISRGLKRFELVSSIRKEKRNMYNLIVTNKWFSLFLNYFFDIPFKKKEFRLPFLLTMESKNTILESSFWRGLYDSEGHVGSTISFSNKLLNIHSNLIDFLKRNKIKAYKLNHYEGTLKTYIYRDDFKNFGKAIGFFHPQKQKQLIKELCKGSAESKFKRINTSNLINDKYFDLRKIKNLRVHGLGYLVRFVRKEMKCSQAKLAKNLSVNEWNIRYWERGKSIPFLKVIGLMRLIGSKDIISIFKEFEKKNLMFCFGKIKISNKIKLTLKVDNDLLFLAKNIYPTRKYVQIRRKPSHKFLSRKEIKETINLLEKKFSVKVKHNEANNNLYVSSTLLTKFFKKFFVYEKRCAPINKKELNCLRIFWNNI